MTPIDEAPDIATLVSEVAAVLPPEMAEQVTSLPADDLDTLGVGYIALVSLETPAPVDLVAEVEAVLGAGRTPSSKGEDGTVPDVVTY